MKIIDFSFIPQIKNLLSKDSRIAIVTHVNPDGDALGSSLALYHYFTENGYNITPIVPNGYPDYLHHMQGDKAIVSYSKYKLEVESILHNADLLFCVDFNTPSRVGHLEQPVRDSKAVKVMIDHHPQPDGFVDYTVSETWASSASELVFRFIKAFEPEAVLSTAAAEALYAGIMTDTGNFSFNSSNPDTFEIVAALLRAGIDKDKITENIHNTFTENRLRLTGYALSTKMVVHKKLRTGYIWLDNNDKKQFKYTKGDAEGFVNRPLAIKEVVFSAIFIENEDHVKISFRSKGTFNTNEFARAHFNGGGHRNASGGRFNGTIKDAIDTFERLLVEYKPKLNAEVVNN